MHNVGGVIGRITSRFTSGERSTYLRGSVNSGVVTGFASHVGGVVGYINVGTTASTGNVHLNPSSTPLGHVVNNENTGVVIGLLNVGGVIGRIDAPVITNLSKNPLLLIFNDEIGRSHTSIVYGCRNDGDVFGYGNVGGIIGTSNASGNLTNFNDKAQAMVNHIKANTAAITSAANIFIEGTYNAALIGIHDAFNSEYNTKRTGWLTSILTATGNFVTNAATWASSTYYSVATYVKFLNNTHIIAIQSCENTGTVTGGSFLAGIVGMAGDFMVMHTASVENNGTVTSINEGEKSNIWNNLVLGNL